ncbi:MAG TPA: Lpg1974 family pore-forming outer membrane protein [Aestuariivirga sp.]|nr:Lpg1974 family pore-forming outer membrane protein [Aestuariivirga sp.]
MKKSISNTAIAAVTAGAAASIGSTAGLAADPIVGTEPEWFLSLEGGVIFADPAMDKVGEAGEILSDIGFNITDSNDFDTEFGYRGAAKFGKKFDDDLDWRIGVAYSNIMKNHSSLTFSGSGLGGSGSGNLGQNSDLSYLTADVELGYNVRPSDRFDLRVFGGLRVLNSKDSGDKFGELPNGFLGSSGFSFDSSTDSEFLGLGPRVGVDFSGKLSDDSVLGFSGMLAAAVIIGDLKQRNEAIVSSGGSSFPIFSDTDHTTEMVFNLEAAFGADFHLTDSAVLTLGYRGEMVDRFSDKTGVFPSVETTRSDFLSHGPFVRLIAEF